MSNVFLVILLISVGFILFLLELFTPGFGFCGIGGLILIVVGSYLAYTKLNLLWGIFSSLASLLGVVFFFKLFTKTGIWKRLRLDIREDKEKGFRIGRNLEELLNKEGLTLSPLKPSGIANIEGKRQDVVSEGMYIDKGKKIQVIGIKDNRIIVREKI